MELDGAVIRALVLAAERCGGAVNLGRRSGIDPSCISRYLRGKVRSVSDDNWNKLRKILETVSCDRFYETAHPVVEWKELLKDPGQLLRNGGVEQLILRAQGLEMAPQICDRDLILVRQKESLTDVPENKIVVAVFKPFCAESQRAVCKRLRRINGDCWFFSDEPQGFFFPAENKEILWIGVVLRKICEL